MLSDKIQVENKLAECQLAESESHFETHFSLPAAHFLCCFDLEHRVMRITKLWILIQWLPIRLKLAYNKDVIFSFYKVPSPTLCPIRRQEHSRDQKCEDDN